MTSRTSTGTVQAVLFDWDGTLVDTGDILLRCWHVMSERVLGYRFPVDEADRRKFLAMRGADSFPLLANSPEQLKAMEVGFTAAYLELAPQTLRVYDGATELLTRLQSEGVRTGVVTSKTRERFECDAEISGLTAHLDVIITGDDVAKAKPDPEGVWAGLAALNTGAENAWFGGDSPADVKAGRAAGLVTIALTYGLHHEEEFDGLDPSHVIHSTDDLSALLFDQTSD